MQEPQGMTPTECVVDVFGSLHGVGRAIGVEASTVLRWGAKRGGLIPHEHMAPLLDAAAKIGKRLTIEEVVWGRPAVARQIITFLTPTPIGEMARVLTQAAEMRCNPKPERRTTRESKASAGASA